MDWCGKRDDVEPNGTHPSLVRRDKVAHLLMEFLKTDPTAKVWFLGQTILGQTT